jgi:ribosome biogenesis GTPase
MFFTSRGAMIIDTPGLREIQIAGDDEDLSNLFADLELIMRSCRFTNCTHGNEPGCAVTEAIRTGRLHEEELRRFNKMQREADYNRRRTDAAHAANTKKRWKQIHKEQRQKNKLS